MDQNINDAFDNMQLLLQTDTELDIDNLPIEKPIKIIKPPPAPFLKTEKKTKSLIKTPKLYDTKNNMLIAENRNSFKTEIVIEENDIFTKSLSTTNTMEGSLSNVQFHEQDLIKLLEPNEIFVRFKCNYGEKTHASYTDPVKVRKTNRGRKKKIKPPNFRKKQGDGSAFNSQITFFIRRSADHNIIPYKFKVFRTGTIQLPGVKQNDIDDVVECVKKIAELLGHTLHPENPQLVQVKNINHLMKNYKFIVKISPQHIIDLMEFSNILDHTALPGQPVIYMKKYSRQDTKIAIKFLTPVFGKTTKKTRVNIFMSGKINILGALDLDATRGICDYLAYIIRNNPQIIAKSGS